LRRIINESFYAYYFLSLAYRLREYLLALVEPPNFHHRDHWSDHIEPLKQKAALLHLVVTSLIMVGIADSRHAVSPSKIVY
jgi:hypothetical protein